MLLSYKYGSGRTHQDLERLGPYELQAPVLGPVFARHGYVFLYLFRRGVGLSADQGTNAVDAMNREFAAHGQDGRNAIQLRLFADAHCGQIVLSAASLEAYQVRSVELDLRCVLDD